jgi:predicted amidohydrolase YtcJ
VPAIAGERNGGPLTRLRFAGGAVFTGNRDRLWVDSVAVDGDRVVAVGTADETAHALPGAQDVDLAGRVVLPGFIDAHNHFLATGEALASIDLRAAGINTTEALVAAVAARRSTTATDQTVSGSGLDPDAFEGAQPTRFDLDAASADQPVVIYHVSGHGALVNSEVLRRAGVTDEVADPPGGRFVRDAAGRLTGLCFDTALQQVVSMAVDIGDHGPNFHTTASDADLTAAVLRAQDAYLASGLTTVCDAQVTAREIRGYQLVHDRGELVIRTVCMPLSHQLDSLLQVGLRPPFGDELLSLGPMKFYADGSITAGTHYCSTPAGSTSGYLFRDAKVLQADLARVQAAGWRVGVHAQGDLAIDLVLDGLEEAQRQHPMDDARPRIEHAGLPTASAIGRMAALRVVTVNQPGYLFEFGDTLRSRMGDTTDRLQPLRDELRAGARVVISSDSDVASYRPLHTVAAAIERRTRGGDVLGAGQELTLDEALLAHTADAAHALGHEELLGRLRPGGAADLVVVDDPRALPAARLRDLTVHATMVAGRWRYQHAE